MPEEVPDSLFAAEYLQLAKDYSTYFKYDRVLQCVDKIRKMSPKSKIAKDAERLRSARVPKVLPSPKELQLLLQASNLSVAETERLKLARAFTVKYPNSEAGWCNLAEQIQRTKPFDKEVCECYHRATEINPNYLKALEGEVLCVERQQGLPEAKALHEKIVSLDPENIYSNQQLNMNIPQEVYSLGSQDVFSACLFELRKWFDNFLNENWGSGYLAKDGQVQYFKKFEHGLPFPWEFVFDKNLEKFPKNTYSEGLLFDGSRFVDKKGNTAFPGVFQDGDVFSEGACGVAINNKWGYINKKGEIIVKPIYEGNRLYKDGLAPVLLNGRWGYIDKGGKEVIPFKYESAKEFSEGLASVRINDKFGFIDKSGNLVIKPVYDDSGSFHDGVAQVTILETPIKRHHQKYIRKDGSVAFDLQEILLKLDSTGSSIPNGFLGRNARGNPRTWAERNDSLCGRIRFRANDKYGFLDTGGKIVVKPQFAGAGEFSEGLAVVANHEGSRNSERPKYNFIDTAGNIAIKDQFVSAFDFSEGLAFVKTKEKAGFIDKTGTMKFEFKDVDANSFHDGMAAFQIPKPDYYQRARPIVGGATILK